MKKACVVGYGNIGPVHTAALEKAGNLYAVCDIDEKKLKCAKEKHKNILTFSDYAKVLSDKNIGSVHICTPHYLHAPMVEAALQNGKDVVLEKPAAMSLAEFEHLKKIIEASENRVCVILQNRLNNCIVKLKEIAEKKGVPIGVCGFLTWQRTKEYYESASWRGKKATEGGALLINQAIHLLDMMQYIAGEPSGAEGSIFNHSLKGVIECEDTCEAIISFKNGCKGAFYATNAYSLTSPYRLEVSYSDATYRYSDNCLYEIIENTPPKIIESDCTAKIGKYIWGNAHETVLERFYSEKEAYGTIEDAYNAHKLVYAIYKSAAENGKYVKLGEK